ncbi:MAG TPA: DUF2197 domain-containing protein [Verrucomicrobiae bacterium]|nr:DUF2197 domain-containing protein [Verrucomicrobiae bacterium]
MEVRCKICGATTRLTKAHKDYTKIARSASPYICDKCSAWIEFEMQATQDFRRKKR